MKLKKAFRTLKEFVAIDQNDIYTPESVGRISNQDLKGTIFANGNVDYLIITNDQFLGEANRLANLHKNSSNLNVKVIPLEIIYNEFSSGDRKSTRLNSSHVRISYAVFCLKKKTTERPPPT